MLTKIEKLRNKKGFSLMELMIVIVIIGILAAGSLIIFGDKGEKAKQASTNETIRKKARLNEIKQNKTKQVQIK